MKKELDMKERLNALKVALNNEIREREFYLKNAQRTKNPVSKAMFTQIAGEEMEHYERLKQVHENWEKGKIWPETVPLKVKDTIVKTVLREAAKNASKTFNRDADDLKAIQMAIDFEFKGAESYAKLRDEVIDPKEKAFFNLLSNIEHEHYASLRDTELYLTDPGSWFMEWEDPNLEGA
jgi:rubrerythrin